MLAELRIRDFALIDELAVQFGSGLQVLTGETGAGKSILVDAIALLVGGRASADQIRTGADEAVLEAAFAFEDGHPVLARLREQGVLEADQRELIVRRVLSRAGRHRLYLNGSLTPLNLLQQFAGTLVDIHGQHEQQSLLSAALQLDALDAFDGLRELRREYGGQYDRWRASAEWLERAESAARDRAAREELLRFQHQELHDADLRAGEEGELEIERQRLAHGRRLGELAAALYAELYESDGAMLSRLGAMDQALNELAGIDSTTAEWREAAKGAGAQLRELAHAVRAYRDELDEDPARLAAVEERLDRLRRLRKKYGETEAALLARADEVAREVAALEHGDAQLTELRAHLEADRRRLGELAGKLSEGRKAAAQKMDKRMLAELRALRMERTRFRVQVTPEPGEFTLSGADRVEYLLSANEGEPLQPLARVASGGELSRIMLALKSVLADSDGVPVLIFDEVDTGVGGAVAAVMGKRLRALGAYHQVFCITHLPQVASHADRHYVVRKDVVRKRTRVSVTALAEPQRRREVARMLAGVTISDAALATAAELLDSRS